MREVRADPYVRLAALLTTVTEGYARISMHGVRRSLLHVQAEALGLPLVEIEIPPECPNRVYEERMAAGLGAQIEARGVRGVVYGDIFLQDVRDYRERQLGAVGLRPIFPLWGRDTGALARGFIDDGFRAVLCAVDRGQVDGGFVGRDYDHRLLDELPETADPCGENGEFHTFVHAGPLFHAPVPLRRGERVERDGFWFCDLHSPTLEP